MNKASIPSLPLSAERSPWLRGPMRLPGEPLLSALALILAAMARGESVLDTVSPAPELAATAEVLRALGAYVAPAGPRWHVQGLGVGGLLTPAGPLPLAETGAAAPLLIGLIAGHDMEVVLDGPPADPVSEALLGFLGRNGCRIARDGGQMRLCGPRFGVPLDLALPAEAAGLVAPLLLNALVTVGRSRLTLPAGSHDPAIDLLAAFGARLGAEEDAAGLRLGLEGLAPLRAQALTVPGDPHLAVYPAVAALIAPDSELTLSGVALTARGLALFDALALMGGDIAIGAAQKGGADIVVRHGGLQGAVIPAELGIAAEDFPILCVAAAFAAGDTRFEGLGEGVRRLALTRALRANGVDCIEQQGGLLVRGSKRVPGGGNVAPRLDPKLAMAFLVLGMAADRAVSIEDGTVMAELFPDFVTAFEHVGASFSSAPAAGGPAA
ncbi:MAG: hypothetical protein BGO82_10670 [Devosia sp. 67-54]|uniref:hypothetical protein n=1 Tax=unclassified Devosia TaxID=196773 RepID=UPI00095F6CDF|nr:MULTISPECIES: hypothetical protein [unclassified Devosia]MBN9304902.1 hypothetical protein [Devosia sp.]OJX15147.1 MAG: hypothetical protein BGO82_10670 [Devosia sp. 67-54]